MARGCSSRPGLALGPRGLALIGTVLEQAGGTTAPGLQLHADSDLTTVENMLCIGVTAAGARTNWLYNDIGTTATAKRGVLRNCVMMNRNTKSDVFGQSGNLTGNWPAIYDVGARSNVAIQGGDDLRSVPGVGNWLGEVAALGDLSGSAAAPLAVEFVDDQSTTGGKAGNGDYTPGVGSVVPMVPAGMAPFAVDMKGRALGNDGTGRVGAIQPV